MRIEGFVTLWLIVAASSAAAGGESSGEIVVLGEPPEARAVAEKTATRWRGLPWGEGQVERILEDVGASLVQAGWGVGALEARVDSLENGLICRLELIGVGPSQLASWSWDPPIDRADLDPGVWRPAEGDRILSQILEDVGEEGYPFASIQILEASDRADGIVVRARLREGPRLDLASVRFEGAGSTRTGYLERVADLRLGEPIRIGEAVRARERLERTGLFREVNGPWLRALGDRKATLVYRMKSFPQNRAEGAIGYDGKSRTLRGSVHVDLGNLFGTGRSLHGSWERIDTDRSQLDLSYREPFLFGLPLSAELLLFQYLEDSTWTEDELRAVLDADLKAGWSGRVGIGWERTVFSGEPPGNTKRVATILGLEVDRRSEFGTRGGRFELELDTGSIQTSPRASDGEGRIAILRFGGERNLLFGRQVQIRLELQGGSISGPDSIPRPEALGLGGGSDLRGYAERQFRVLRFGLARLEAGLRHLPAGNRLYGFVDGALIRPWPTGGTQRKIGYGVGVGVLGRGGWVRLDYGIAGKEAPLSGRIHFRLETRF